jgi:hypothetical protein
MENLLNKIQVKFNSLSKTEKVAAITISSLFVGMFFFVSGISVGEAFYKISH